MMFSSAQTPRSGASIICGSFTTGSDSSVSSYSFLGAPGFTVTKPTGTGLYRLNSDRKFKAVMFASGCQSKNAAPTHSITPYGEDIDGSSGGGSYVDFQVALLSSHAAADPGAATFQLLLVVDKGL